MVADLALLNGWQPDIIGDLEIQELDYWHKLALAADKRRAERLGTAS